MMKRRFYYIMVFALLSSLVTFCGCHTTKYNSIHSFNDSRGTFPVYGNWCGPAHPKSSSNPDPIDNIDAACKKHDVCYEKKGYFDCSCNEQLATDLINGQYSSIIQKTVSSEIILWMSGQPCVSKNTIFSREFWLSDDIIKVMPTPQGLLFPIAEIITPKVIGNIIYRWVNMPTESTNNNIMKNNKINEAPVKQIYIPTIVTPYSDDIPNRINKDEEELAEESDELQLLLLPPPPPPPPPRRIISPSSSHQEIEINSDILFPNGLPKSDKSPSSSHQEIEINSDILFPNGLPKAASDKLQ